MKKEIPILMSTQMVQAILAGRKTMTRRIVKPQLPEDAYEINLFNPPDWHENTHAEKGIYYWSKPGIIRFPKLPYGLPGDIIWIRETHYRYGYWKKNGKTKLGRQKWKFIPDPHFTEVRFVGEEPYSIEKNSYRKIGWYKRLARFMPKQMCRIWLYVTGVKIERLKDINEDAAKSEGIEVLINKKEYTLYKAYSGAALENNGGFTQAKIAFENLWETINGEGSWNINPWVWVISFKVLSITGKPGVG